MVFDFSTFFFLGVAFFDAAGLLFAVVFFFDAAGFFAEDFGFAVLGFFSSFASFVFLLFYVVHIFFSISTTRQTCIKQQMTLLN